jgi:hypothetical protein
MSIQMDEIRQRVTDVATKRVRPLLASSPPATKSTFGLIAFLGFCILLLSTATFFVLRNRSQSQPIELRKTTQALSSSPSYLTKSDLDSVLFRMEKADRRMDMLAHRTWLLSLGMNENASIQQSNDLKRFGVRDSGYILFDENWKLNRVPQSMILDEKQKRDIVK